MQTKQQEIFEISVTHMLKQGQPAIETRNPAAKCLYRTRDGLKCAIGCLIPDELYDPELEDYSTLDSELRKCIPLIDDSVSDEFLGDLQQIHDAAAGSELKVAGGFYKAVYEYAKSFARRFQLDTSFMENIP